MTDRLRTKGFRFTRTEISVPVLAADYGEGYRSRGVIIGAPAGLRTWSATISVLPEASRCGEVSRATYLWEFWLAMKAANDAPFFIYDHKDDLFYLASFTDDELSYELLCARVFSTGLNFRERRDLNITSPIVGFPILDEAGAAIFDEAGDPLIEEGIF
jgi:hypothetical protein